MAGVRPGDTDERKVYEDVKRLLFEGCKDTTPWDHLGNTEPVRQAPGKHVTFAPPAKNCADVALHRVELPPGLAAMFIVRSAQQPARSELLRLLDLAARPPPPPDHCVTLYEKGMARLARLRAEEQARIRAALEAEERECTFQPKVSETSKGNHSKESLEKFFERSVEWLRNRKKKMDAKRAKEEREAAEEFASFKTEVSERSQKLAERHRQKQNQGDDHKTPQRLTRALDGYISPSFMPVTNSAAKIEEYFLRNANVSDVNSSRSTSCRSGGDSDASAAVRGISGLTTASTIVQRLEEDIAARRQRQEERRRLFIMKQKERLYDKVTGQPLFVPNAMPMVEMGKDGRRIPFEKLSPAEKKEYFKRLRSHHIDLIPKLAVRKDNRPTRDIEAVVRDMTERQREATKAIARIKRKDEQELTKLFKPQLEGRSVEIASSKEQRLPLYKLPLPKRDSTTPEESRSASKPSDPRRIESMLCRTEQWKRQKDAQFERKKREAEAEKARECTFKPRLNPASHHLVSAAESRYAAELVQESQGRSPSMLLASNVSPPGPHYLTPSFRLDATQQSAAAHTPSTYQDPHSQSSARLSSTYGSMSRRPRNVQQAAGEPSSCFDASPSGEEATGMAVEGVVVDKSLDELLSSWKDLDRLTDEALGL